MLILVSKSFCSHVSFSWCIQGCLLTDSFSQLWFSLLLSLQDPHTGVTHFYAFWPHLPQLSLNPGRIGNARISSWVTLRPLSYCKGHKWIKKKKSSWMWARERIKFRGRDYFLSRTLSQSGLTQPSLYWFLNSHYHTWKDSPLGVLISHISLAYFTVSFLSMTLFYFESWQPLFALSTYSFPPPLKEFQVFTFKIYKDYCKKNKLGRQAVTGAESLSEANWKCLFSKLVIPHDVAPS